MVIRLVLKLKLPPPLPSLYPHHLSLHQFSTSLSARATPPLPTTPPPPKTPQETEKEEALPLTDIQHAPTSPPSPIHSEPEPPEPEPVIPPPQPEPEPIAPEPVARVRRPIGGFRGGLIGFFLATTLAGTYGYFTLLSDYTKASEVLLLSVEELKESTSKLTKHIERIEKVETQLDELVKTVARQKEVEKLRDEFKQRIESEHLDLLALKTHIWGVEQDLNALSKRKSNQIRI